MFTGIIEELGNVKSIQQSGKGFSLRVTASKVLSDVRIGDSISTNGVCLTVTSFDSSSFTADVMPETYNRTAFKYLKLGESVNLERAMALGDRFGGHIVSGHIDGTGMLAGYKQDDNATWVTIKAGPEIMKYVIMKGSVALDGISLTVAACQEDAFKVSIIPETGRETTLLNKKQGDLINIECDVVGKYIERLMGFKASESKRNVTADFLAQNGFM